MNNSKIWLVVNPTVGIPLFLGAVAVGSFAVHLAVVTNTEWVSGFLSGEALSGETAALDTQDKVQQASAPATTFGGGERIQITMPDGTTAWAVIEADTTTLASALLPRSGN
jgi:light-harvesting protein B-800-850 alpha chain